MSEIEQVEVLLTRAPDGTELDEPVRLYVEAWRAPGEVEVSNRLVEGLDNVLNAVRAVAGQIGETLKYLTPDKFTVELGFEMKAEGGGLVAMLVRTGGSASLKVTLEWEKDEKKALEPQRS